jgi:hypothetical protein
MKQPYLQNTLVIRTGLCPLQFLAIIFLLLLGVLPTAAQNTCPSPVFRLGITFPFDNGSSNLNVADVNGDQRPDLLSIGNGRLVVMLGQEGGLASASSYPTGGSENMGMGIGDLNGDGRADVVIANHRSTIGVLLASGGGFGPATNYVSGLSPYQENFPKDIAIADFNGDGWADLAVGNRDSYVGSLGLLMNKGDGTFAPVVELPGAGKSPGAVVTSDFNGDGKADLAVTSHDGLIRVLLGQVGGSFAPPVFYGSGGGNLAVRDLNNDGRPDLAVTYNNSVGVLLNDGAGGFSPIQYYASGGRGLTGFAFGDLNGDGRDDIATSHYQSYTVGVLLSQSGGGYAPAINYTGGPYGTSVAIGNWDGVGGNDIAVTNMLASNIAILVNTCTPPDLKTFYRDMDEDGYGDPNMPAFAETMPWGFVMNKEDCDDTRVTYVDADGDGYGTHVIVPCGAPNNQDCNDGDANESPFRAWFIDKDRDGYAATGSIAYQCNRPPDGYTSSELTALDDCDDNNPALTNGKTTWYFDYDGDGYYGNIAVTMSCDLQPPAPIGYYLTTKGHDCDDYDASVHATTTFYLDEDRDGYGGTAYPVDWCTQFPPYGFSTNNSDCNDGDASIYPDAPELMDGKDNNCNGKTDETLEPITWYRDYDKDGFGDPKRTLISPMQPAGYVANSLDCNDYAVTYEDKDNDGRGSTVKVPCSQIYRSDDCNDNDRTVHSLQTFYRDADGDSYGNVNNKIQLCFSTPPPGYVKNSIDCNDADAKVYWPKTYYRDADGDGFGDKNNKTAVCASAPPNGYVTTMNDCDDKTVLFWDGDKDGYGSNKRVACGGVANNLDCDDNNPADKGCTTNTCPTTVFTPIDMYSSGGSGPSSIAIADFNGDGKRDLAVSNYSSPKVGVLLNNGSGSFAPAISFAHGGSGVTSLTAADFNGDGKQDLAVALETFELTNIALLINDGNGGFSAPVLFSSSGRMPQSIVSGDFNADGIADLAVANFILNVGVLLGNGSGGFAPAVNYHTAGQNCVSITTGDFNNDGKQDLAVANHGTDNIGILLNNGSGFAPATAFNSGGWTPTSVAAGDFNGDGRTDLAVTNDASDNISVFHNNGNGSFVQATSFYSGGHRPHSLKTGDFNGDRKLDLVMTNSSSHQVGIHLNNGSGGFLPSINYISGGQNPGFVATGQLNEDDRLDLVVANAGSNNVGVMLNACSAVPQQLTKAKEQPQSKPSLTATDEGSTIAVALSAIPNPMGYKTLIRYKVKASAEVNIRMYDVLGQEVGVVFSGKQSAGVHQVEYNTSRLASGVYFCRMITTVKGKAEVHMIKLVKAE